MTNSDLTGNTISSVDNVTSVNVDASGNWWGSNDETVVQSKSIGSVDFTPFLDNGVDQDAGAHGFSGDHSHMHVTALGAQAGTTGRVQEGLNLVSNLGTVEVHDGTYAESVVINQSVSLQATHPHLAILAPTTGGQQTVVGVNAANVQIDGLAIQVNQNNNGSGQPIAPVGIAAVGTTFDGLKVTNNVITSIGDSPANWVINAGLTVRAAGIVLFNNGGVLESVTIQNNDVEITSGNSFFQRAVFLKELHAQITGNTFAGAANDLIFQFASGGSSLIDNNHFVGAQISGGGGVVIADPNSGSPIDITNNFFTPAATALPSNALLVNRNVNGDTSPILIKDNAFTGFSDVAVDIGGASGVTVQHNTFTPKAGATNFRDISVDSQDASGNAAASTPIDTQIFANTFHRPAGTSGTAIVLASSLAGATYAAGGVQVGVQGANTYDSGFTSGVGVTGGTATIQDNLGDATTGVNISGGSVKVTGSTLTNNTTAISVTGPGSLEIGSANVISGGTTGLRLSGSAVGLSGMSLDHLSISGTSGDYITLAAGAFDGQNLDGTGLTLDGVAVSSMTPSQYFAAENKITDQLDDSSLGLVVLAENTIYVTPTSTPTSTDNDYTRLKNAVEAAGNGWTINLEGTFNWGEANALASWALGNDGASGTNDDYSILVPANLHNVTITAPGGLGSATIQGPGDIASFDLEGFLVFWTPGSASNNQGWTISNLQIYDFDLGLGFFFDTSVDQFANTTITNNHIRVAQDVATAGDTAQNIGIHLAFGKNQSITNNTIDLDGGGLSDSGNSNFASEVALQTNTSGGDVYDHLLIDHNIINVLHAQSADPEIIRGIWDNTDGTASNITISNNQFNNLNSGNDPALNKQIAYRLTSPSSASTTVTWSGNTVDGANVGFAYYPGYNNAGTQPVQILNNTLTNVFKGFDFSGATSVSHLSGNSISGFGGGIGIDVGENSVVTLDNSAAENSITGFATGVRFASGGGGSITNTNFEGGANPDNGTDLRLDSDAGAVTLGGNTFAGGTFIDNQSSAELNATGDTFKLDGATSIAPADNNLDDLFAVENRITDGLDPAQAGGLVRLRAGNVYVTQLSGSIQRGVNLALAGDTVTVQDGTYVEQVVIQGAGKNNLTLQGQSQAGTIIQSPASLPAGFNSPSPNHPVVFIENTNATVENLTVDGNGQGGNGGANSNYRIIGVGFHNAGGAVDHTTVEHVRETPFSGDQQGNGIYAFNDDSTARTVNFTFNNVFDYQKNGITANGAALTANISNNTVTGQGLSGINGQNGIQIGFGALGHVDHNVISNNTYDGNTAAGILLYQAATGTTVTNNTVTGSDFGVAAFDSSATIDANTLTNNSVGVLADGFGAPAVVEVSNNTLNDNTDGIELYDDVSGTSIHNNFIQSNSKDGVYIDSTVSSGNVAINYNSISGNVQAGLEDASTGPTTVNASYNWWGAADGPNKLPFNAGHGDTIIDPPLAFGPWLTDGTDTSAAPGFQPNNTLGISISGAVSGVEGSSYTLTLGPSADIASWDINWGDSSPIEHVVGNPNSVTHTFLEEGRYTINAVATTNGNVQANSNSVNVTIADAALHAGAVTPPTPTERRTDRRFPNLPFHR